MRKLLVLLVVLGGALAGCGSSETAVTKAEEEAFRNPPKEIPPESLKAMQEARAKAAQMSQDAMKKSSQGGGQ